MIVCWYSLLTFYSTKFIRYLANKSIGAALLGALVVLFNNGEVWEMLSCSAHQSQKLTRVMWTPPLRESFAMPFLVLEFLAVLVTLKWVHLFFVRLVTTIGQRTHPTATALLSL